MVYLSKAIPMNGFKRSKLRLLGILEFHTLVGIGYCLGDINRDDGPRDDWHKNRFHKFFYNKKAAKLIDTTTNQAMDTFRVIPNVFPSSYQSNAVHC